MEIYKEFGKATLDDIRELEENYSVTLPEEYIDFLLTCNGGVVHTQNKGINIQFEGSSSNYEGSSYLVIEVMYGVNTGNKNTDIQTWMEEYQDEMLPESIIIGNDIMNGFIVLICEGEHSGVYYWDDCYNLESSNDEVNTYLLAKDFSSFMSLLKK